MEPRDGHRGAGAAAAGGGGGADAALVRQGPHGRRQVMATLELHDMRKQFGATHVLHGIDLALASGEMLVIVGASGCGKSTLLRLVAGLEEVSSGRIVLDGRDIAGLDPAARDIAMV